MWPCFKRVKSLASCEGLLSLKFNHFSVIAFRPHGTHFLVFLDRHAKEWTTESAKPALQATRGRGTRTRTNTNPSGSEENAAGGPSSSSIQVRVKSFLFQGDSARWLPFACAHLGGQVREYTYTTSGSAQVMPVVSDLVPSGQFSIQ